MTNQGKRSALTILLMSFIYILPLILSNNLYADDIWRVWSGYPGFLENGRFMSELLMFLISSGYGVLDSFPIPQIAASFIYWWSGYSLSKHISPNKTETWHIIIGSSFLIGPFTIAQVSYRFDSITMALSVFLATYSFLLYKDNIKGYLCTLILIIASLGFYQPSMILAACLPFVGMVISKEKISARTHAEKTFKFTLILLMGFIVYTKLILRFLPTGKYTADHSGIVSASKDSIPIIKSSISSINDIFVDLFSSPEFAILIIILALPFILICVSSIKNSDWIITLPTKAISILVIACTLYIPISLLKHPIIEPRVLSSGCLLIFLFFSAASEMPKFKFGMIVSCLIISHFFIMISIFSNVLSQTNNENKNFNNSLSFTLINSGWRDGGSLYFSGRLKHTPPVSRFIEKFPYYKRILQYYYVDSYVLGYYTSNINGLNIIRDGDYYMPTVSDEWKIISSNNYGDLYLKNDKYLFKFNE